MLPDLAPPLTTYFEASNAYDADALVAAFADNASVHDEGRKMVGPVAIRDWAEDSFRKYRARLTPKQISRRGDAVIVAVAVAGSVPGSPIELAFRFRLAGVKIAALEIG